MGTSVYQYQGILHTASGSSPFGRILAGETWDSTTTRAKAIFIDKGAIASGATISSNLTGTAIGEQLLLDVVGAGENGHVVTCSVPSSTGTGLSHTKGGLIGQIATASNSNVGGGVVYLAAALAGQASTAGTVAQGNICGVLAQAQTIGGTDSTSSAMTALMINSGTAVSTVNTALSKVGLSLLSSGSAKNTAFAYCVKSASSGGTVPAVNCSHGILVDSASIDANAFAVVSGTTPTVVWGVGADGKNTVAVTAPGAGGGPFAGGSAANITISLTGLTTAAQALSAAITVNTTAVTASSRIWAQVISYAYGAAGAMAAGWPAVSLPASNITAGTSFTFQIANLGTGALSGAIGIAFKIEN